MTDPKTVSMPTGQPPASDSQPNPSQTTGEQQQEHLTEEKIRLIARQEARRASQSLTDKAEARIQEKLDAMKQSGVEPTPEQEEKLRSTVAQQITEEERSNGGAAPQPTPAQGPVDPRVKIALEAMTEEGVQVMDGDPELPALLEVLNNPGVKPYQIVKATQKAIEAKRERTTLQASTAHLRTPAGGGESSSGTPAASAHDLWKDAYKK
jgi:hypothetical protein